MSSVTFNEDCMAGMARYPDKYFDLAVVDPPYAINRSKTGKLQGSESTEALKQ